MEDSEATKTPNEKFMGILRVVILAGFFLMMIYLIVSKFNAI